MCKPLGLEVWASLRLLRDSRVEGKAAENGALGVMTFKACAEKQWPDRKTTVFGI